jgi:hypothetical protein
MANSVPAHPLARNMTIGAAGTVVLLLIGAAISILLSSEPRAGDTLEWFMMYVYIAGMPATLVMQFLSGRFPVVALMVLLISVPLNGAMIGAVVTFGMRLRRTLP